VSSQSLSLSFKTQVKEACDLMLQITAAVAVLHSQQPPVAHRDLKLENVLVMGGGAGHGLTLKLCDFGSCSVGPQSLKSQEERCHQEEVVEKNTTQMYRAPEMVDLYACSELDESVDVWALGGVFFALLYHVHPFQEAGNLGILSGNWRQALPSASASLTPASSQAGAAAGGARAETVGWVAEKYKPFHALFERMFTKVHWELLLFAW